MSDEKIFDRLDRLMNERDFVSGIHNYCDRWCERCLFTSKCMVYAMEEEEQREAERSGKAETDPFAYVHQVFQEVSEKLRQWADEQGIDLNAEPDEDVKIAEVKRKSGASDFVSIESEVYGKWLMNWLKENHTETETIKKELGNTDTHALAAFTDALEVLGWYMFFPAAKFRRASSDPYEDSDTGHADRNGSAKVAIIAVERTMAALAVVLRYMPSHEDEMLDVLIRLDRIRKQALLDYPEAMAFKRPGLDD